jgi:nucleoid DNA-binding protein
MATYVITNTIFDIMKKAVTKGDRVEIRRFGNFRLKTRTEENVLRVFVEAVFPLNPEIIL